MRVYVLVEAVFLLCLVLASDVSSHSTVSSEELKRTRCIVCTGAVDKLVSQLAKVSLTKKADPTSYKILKSGDKESAPVPLKASEVFISDKIDGVCDDLSDNIFAYSKESGEKYLVNLVAEDGSMVDLNIFDIEQDFEVNNMIPEHCKSIMSEYEDELIDVLKSGAKDPNIKFCHDITGFCERIVDKDEL